VGRHLVSDVLRLRDVTLSEVQLPFRKPLKTAYDTIESRKIIRLKMVDVQGRVGWGEAAPLDGFGPDLFRENREALDGVLGSLSSLSVEPNCRGVAKGVGALCLPPSATFAMEQGLLSLLAQRTASAGGIAGLFVGAQVRTEIPLSRLVHDASGAAQAMKDGVETVKIKVGAGVIEEDLDRVAAVRRTMGKHGTIRLDANGAWNVPQAYAFFAQAKGLGVECVEDPVGDWAALASLRRMLAMANIDIPIAIDEGVWRLAGDDSQVLTLKDLADVVVIKPMWMGGLVAAVQMAHKVVETGLGLIVTSVLDGVVGRAGAMEVARAVPRSEENALWPCGLDTGHLFSVQEDASCL